MAEARVRTRGRLPHWEQPGSIYFVTFRLAGSLPRDVVAMAKAEVRDYRRLGVRAAIDGKRRAVRRIERYLDQGTGVAHLGRPEAAKIVADALRQFDGTRYELYAWCVMPNHVHVVFRPLGKWSLAEVLHSWKSFTAKKAARLLGMKPPFGSANTTITWFAMAKNSLASSDMSRKMRPRWG